MRFSLPERMDSSDANLAAAGVGQGPGVWMSPGCQCAPADTRGGGYDFARVRYASFMFSFLGRGVFYIFVGSIIPHEHWATIIIGSIIFLIGVAYVALEFVPSIEPPANMREADAGWGAEQV
ncbi:hypothetical protein N0V85_006922 [Neurospora sp. IMI 360204]|nr:hypothetical protein N0V85_006922 [Neurospora sp. IMI 360204]